VVFFFAIAIVPATLLYYAYRLQGDVRQTYRQSLQSLGSLMEAKLEGSQPGHGERVATLAARMAQRLELPLDVIEQIRFAGYLHDIGKVGVPASLLNRRRDVFSGEPEQVRMHPVIGAQILAPIRFLQPAAEIVRSHHERWDGLGYPARRRGEQIPLGARILALANAYLGMTRSHTQASLTLEQAVSRICQGAGSRFDPHLVGCLARVLKEMGELPAEAASEAQRAEAWAP
jgi:putative nucleotidyltransferase with HDIG domain